MSHKDGSKQNQVEANLADKNPIQHSFPGPPSCLILFPYKTKLVGSWVALVTYTGKAKTGGSLGVYG